MTRQMEEYEIRDVMNRLTGPDLWLEFFISDKEGEGFISRDSTRFVLNIGLINRSPAPAETGFITFWMENKFTPINYGNHITSEPFELNNRPISARKATVIFKQNYPVYGDFVFSVHGGLTGALPYAVELDTDIHRQIAGIEAHLKWEIQSPGMVPRYGIERITSAKNLAFTGGFEVSIENIVKALRDS